MSSRAEVDNLVARLPDAVKGKRAPRVAFGDPGQRRDSGQLAG